MYLFDSEGKRYMDLYAGVSVHALGHCHPELTDAICRQVRTLAHTTTIYLTQPIVDLAEALADVLPGELCRTFFCASGSEANEGAALLASLHTGRHAFLALKGGLHGRTKLTMSLTGLEMWRTDTEPVGGITHVPHPTCRACPWGQTFGQCGYECVSAVETILRLPGRARPAAMFAEPVQGNGGINPAPPGYFERLKEVLGRYGVLLIADEVQTGFGRTGRTMAMDHWSVAAGHRHGRQGAGRLDADRFLLDDRRDRRQLHQARRVHVRRQSGDGCRGAGVPAYTSARPPGRAGGAARRVSSQPTPADG